MSSQQPKIIGEGTYGCVFRPGINCKGKTDSDPKYISKLQSNKETTKNELDISAKIRQIVNYEENFAPIIENCPIKIGQIETREIDNCKSIKDTNLEIDKIQYVGRDTLSKYLFKMLKQHSKKFLELFLETHQVLLESLKKLNQVGIIHNDIKENNIMCRELDGRPILIDFGLSIDKSFMILPPTGSQQDSKTISKLYTYFFKYDTSYEVWCIDIIMLNYMLDILNSDWLNSKITKEQLDKIKQIDPSSQLDSFINKKWYDLIYKLEDNNNILVYKIYDLYGYNWRTKTIKKDEITKIINSYIENFSKHSFVKSKPSIQQMLQQYKVKLSEYFIKFENQTWENLFNELVKFKETWDNYALSIVYLKMLNIMNLSKNEDQEQKISEYEKLLLTVIFSLPNERKKPEETKELIKQVLKTIPKKQMKNVLNIINENISDQKNVLLKIARDQKETNRQERIVYSRGQNNPPLIPVL